MAIAWIKQLLRGHKVDRRITAAAAAEHIELSPTHLLIGMVVAWRNRTKQPVPVKELLVRVHLNRRGKEPLRFYPLERFERVPGHKAVQNKPVRPFTLPANDVHTEQIRFISQEVLDLAPGPYLIDIEIKDSSDVIYLNQLTISLPSKIKYRRSEEWQQDE